METDKYLEQLEQLGEYAEATYAVTGQIYSAMLFVIGIGSAIGVCLLLYNFLKKCY